MADDDAKNRDINISGDATGRDKLSALGGGKGKMDVDALIRAKLRAKEIEDQAGAGNAGGNSGGVNINADGAGDVHIDGKVTGRDDLTVYGNQTITTVQGDQVGGDKFGGDKTGGDKFGGDKVSGDKITAGRDVVSGTQTNTTGLTADDVAKLYEALYKKIAAQPKEDQADLKEAVDTIKQAAEKEATGDKPDAATEKEVKAASQAIVATSPGLLDDVLEVATATLANPAAGVAMIIRKVLEKAKALRGGATA